MKRNAAVLAVAVLAAAPAVAIAQEMNGNPPGAPGSSLMLPAGHLDVRLSGTSQMFLAYVGVGVNADYGALALGPLTLTLGGELTYDTCFLACAAAGLILDEKITDQVITPQARVTLHFPLGGLTQQPVDVYLVASGGLLIASHGAQDNAGTWAWRGTALGPAVGGGLGGNYFWGNVFFTGTEITVAYTAYTYTPEFTSGSTTVSGADVTGGGSNLLVRLFLGLRF